MHKYNIFLVPVVVLQIFFIKPIFASDGDRSEYFKNCIRRCSSADCKESGIEFSNSLEITQNYLNKLLLWTCYDECSYECMWNTTEGYLKRNWSTPQFYGKWPFIRVFGLQEPASVIFSLANLVAHTFMLRKFRQKVRPDSPLYWLWHIFAYICINAWIWSTVYHTRDFPITELFDYTFAYSMVLASLYCMVIRMIHRRSIIAQVTFSLICLVVFINHFSYLSVGKLDYKYNMLANIVTGMASAFGWILWCLFQRKKRPYVWKCFLFVVLTLLSLLFEINDFPPIFWTFDAHSIWHFVTAPLTLLFYSFIIDDCQSLRKELYGSGMEDTRKLL